MTGSHVHAKRSASQRGSDAAALASSKKIDRDLTVEAMERGARSRGITPEARLLAIFDVCDEWFQRSDFEAHSFVTVLLAGGVNRDFGHDSDSTVADLRRLIVELALEAEMSNAEEFALSWHILLRGSVVNAVEGDTEAAMRAQSMARDLIAQHRGRSAKGNLQPPSPDFDEDGWDWGLYG